MLYFRSSTNRFAGMITSANQRRLCLCRSHFNVHSTWTRSGDHEHEGVDVNTVNNQLQALECSTCSTNWTNLHVDCGCIDPQRKPSGIPVHTVLSPPPGAHFGLTGTFIPGQGLIDSSVSHRRQSGLATV
jgi:hypothetical protein